MNLFLLAYFTIFLGTLSLLCLLVMDYKTPFTKAMCLRILVLSLLWPISYICLFIYICYNEFMLWRSLRRLNKLDDDLDKLDDPFEENDYEDESD